MGIINTCTGLDGKSRKLLTAVLLTAMGGPEVQARSHARVKSGNTGEKVACILVHAGGYRGIPRLFNALNACKDLLAEEE